MIGETTGCKLTHMTVDGHRALRMENGQVRIEVDIDRGAHIYEIVDKLTAVDLMYKDPKGVAEHDVGGWYELFPNAGSACVHEGRNIPVHGDVRDLRWEFAVEAESDDRLAVLFTVTSGVFPLRLERLLELRAGKALLRVRERITNLGDTEQVYLWGHHVTFGAPFVGPACRIDLPDCRVYNRTDCASAGSRLRPDASGPLAAMPGVDGEPVDLRYFPSNDGGEMLFIDRLAGHWFNVFNESLGVGCALQWDAKAFPGLWLWQENRFTQDPPFDGSTVAMALEPQASNTPILANAIREGQAPSLKPGESLKTQLSLSVHHRRERVRGVDADGQPIL